MPLETIARPFVLVTTANPRSINSSRSARLRAHRRRAKIIGRLRGANSVPPAHRPRAGWHDAVEAKRRLAGPATRRCTSIGISRLTGPRGASALRSAAAIRSEARHAHRQMRKQPWKWPSAWSAWRGTSMNRSTIAIHERPIDLRRDVQHGRSGGQRFDLTAGGIARGRAGAGDDDAKPVCDTRA